MAFNLLANIEDDEHFDDLYNDISDGLDIEIVEHSLSQRAKRQLPVGYSMWLCTLTKGNCSTQIKIYADDEPSHKDIFTCLVHDARAYSTTDDFADFCNVYGFDENSDSGNVSYAQIVYEECRVQATKLKHLVGKSMFRRFMRCAADFDGLFRP